MAHIYKIFFKLFYLRNSWLTIFHSLAVLAHKTLWMWEAVVETDTLHCEVRRVIHDDDHSSLEIITTHWKLLDDWTELVISQLLSLKMPLIRALYSQKLVALYKYDPTDVVLYLNFLPPFTFLKASSTKRLPIFLSEIKRQTLNGGYTSKAELRNVRDSGHKQLPSCVCLLSQHTQRLNCNRRDTKQ